MAHWSSLSQYLQFQWRNQLFFFFSFTNLARPTGGSTWISSISNSTTLTGENCIMMDALMDAWIKKHVGMGYLANGSGGTPCMKNPLLMLAESAIGTGGIL